MHWTVSIFMVWGVGGRAGGWLQNHKKCIGLFSFLWFWEKTWEGGNWLQNHKKCIEPVHFHGFGSGWEGGEWLQNHKKRNKTVRIFMVSEVGGKGAAGLIIIRKA